MSIILFFLITQYQPQTLAVPPFEHTLGFYRASKYYLRLFLGPNFDYNDPQGIAAVKLKVLDDPKTSRDDDELTVFAVNSGSSQIVYNIGLSAVKVYGNEKMFSQPKGIAANEDGLIALADFGNKRVVKLKYIKGNLEYIGEIKLSGRPFDVCFDSKNNLYITDYDNSKIYVYSPEDSLLRAFGKEGKGYGEVFQPMGIEVIDADAPYNYYREDFVVITDNEGKRVSKFTTSGRFLNCVYSFEIGLAEAKFLYCAVDYFGNIYVTDELNDQIHKFDRNLVYIISEGRTGVGQGEFNSPRGITIGRRYGQVFITEKEGGQYLWISVDAILVGFFPSSFSARQPGTTLALYITDEARIDIDIYNQKGEKIENLVEKLTKPPGEVLIVWDGKDENGNVVPPGEYEFRITVKARHGHGAKIKKYLRGVVKCVES
uniref:FlgD/Vpr Ig-like domain-containing protein n=1 Tax=candidate division WOR-3 bacterium TaxID=2052148 RepID=A0A7V3RID5_UNCW3